MAQAVVARVGQPGPGGGAGSLLEAGAVTRHQGRRAPPLGVPPDQSMRWPGMYCGRRRWWRPPSRWRRILSCRRRWRWLCPCCQRQRCRLPGPSRHRWCWSRRLRTPSRSNGPSHGSMRSASDASRSGWAALWKIGPAVCTVARVARRMSCAVRMANRSASDLRASPQRLGNHVQNKSPSACAGTALVTSIAAVSMPTTSTRFLRFRPSPPAGRCR